MTRFKKLIPRTLADASRALPVTLRHALCLAALTLAFSPHVGAQTAATVSTLYSFTGGSNGGASPEAVLVQSTKDGDFYGTTQGGGSAEDGTVFKITPAGAFTLLHAFSALNSQGRNTDGYFPSALAQDANGNFYGTAQRGGANGQGTFFEVSAAGAFTAPFSFDDSNTGPFYPLAGLVMRAADGDFYGTTEAGGTNNNGTVFKITPAGVLTTVFSFDAEVNGNYNADGTFPEAALVLGTKDGNFYGTALEGGTTGDGTIFQLTPAGAITVLHTFQAGTDGRNPSSELAQDGSGNFYGVIVGTDLNGGGVEEPGNGGTEAMHDGGLHSTDAAIYNLASHGSVYKITPAGVFTLLHHFTRGLTDGAAPGGGLILGKDGNLYGTTLLGGSQDFGTVFRITPAGVFTLLYSFTGMGTDGAYPDAALVLGKDGSFYGTTAYGGTDDDGTVFKVTLSPPAVTSAKTATAQVGVTFSYQITASGNPTSFAATGLPAGLSVSATSGLISGKSTAAGTATVTLKATNAYGTGTASLALTIKPATPQISSPATASATVGKAFSYQITASGSPTSYGVLGLFAGITIDKETGLISGTPTASGTHTLTLQAANAGGTGTKSLTLTVAAK